AALNSAAPQPPAPTPAAHHPPVTQSRMIIHNIKPNPTHQSQNYHGFHSKTTTINFKSENDRHLFMSKIDPKNFDASPRGNRTGTFHANDAANTATPTWNAEMHPNVTVIITTQDKQVTSQLLVQISLPPSNGQRGQTNSMTSMEAPNNTQNTHSVAQGEMDSTTRTNGEASLASLDNGDSAPINIDPPGILAHSQQRPEDQSQSNASMDSEGIAEGDYITVERRDIPAIIIHKEFHPELEKLGWSHLGPHVHLQRLHKPYKTTSRQRGTFIKWKLFSETVKHSSLCRICRQTPTRGHVPTRGTVGRGNDSQSHPCNPAHPLHIQKQQAEL
ncbi:hypothetical protein L9F63_017732, partial [Diploptera punctata]